MNKSKYRSSGLNDGKFERFKYYAPLKRPHFPAFLPSTHNGGGKIGVVYEWIMKNQGAFKSFLVRNG